METLIALFGILGALLIGAISPGPSFVLVARTAIAVSRLDGLAAALGMGIGALIFGSLALLGLRAVLIHVVWLYVAFKLLGGLYLLSVAVRLWRGARTPLVVANGAEKNTTRLRASFALGLTTQLSNPKTAIVYSSIFAAFLPAQLPVWIGGVLLLLILLVETGWYTLVALLLSSERPRAGYLRAKTSIDRMAGAVMGALGIWLMIEIRHPV